MKLKLSSLSVLLCLSMIITSFGIGNAQEVQPLESEWLRQMYQEGWRKVQKGVLQRDTGGGQLETLSYGAEGLQRVVKGYEEQASFLEQRYQASPSSDLSKEIGQLRAEIERLKGELQAAPSADSFNGEALQTCSISYGGDAYAGPNSRSQGVTATASAYFHNDCGYQGDTFATAYAHAIAGTVETTAVRSDPKNSGAWIDSYASVSASGSTACESSAQGSATIGALSIYYQTPYRQNFSCPPPVENTSIYTLDSTAWAQTGTGNLGPLTLIGTNYSLIDSNYVRTATSGRPQAGIAFAGTTVWRSLKLEGQAVDTVSAYANASVIKFEFTCRFTQQVDGTNVILSLGAYDESTYDIDGGTLYGVNIELIPGMRLVAQIWDGRPRRDDMALSHSVPDAIPTYSTNDSFRWVWTESGPGASTGTGQWWRKISGTWQQWGASKPNLWRPVGHAGTRMRIYASEAGTSAATGVEFLGASVTLGNQSPVGQICQP